MVLWTLQMINTCNVRRAILGARGLNAVKAPVLSHRTPRELHNIQAILAYLDPLQLTSEGGVLYFSNNVLSVKTAGLSGFDAACSGTFLNLPQSH